MKKRIGAVLAAVVALLITGCRTPTNQSGTSSQAPTGTKQLKVGALLPLTGPGAQFADYIKKGLDLAAEEINAKEPGSIRIIYEDSKNDPKEGITSFRRLVSTESPPVIVVALSSVTKAVAPMAKENRTVLVGTAVTMPGVTAPSEFVFRVSPEARGIAGVIAQYAAKKYKTAAIAYIDDDFGVSAAEVFEQIFAQGGRKVLLKEPYKPRETDFRTQWQKVKAARPDCVWIVGYGAAYSVLIRQMREAQVKSVLLADMTLGLPVTLKNVGQAAEGVVYVDGPLNPSFAKKFQKRYGEPANSYGGYPYDIIKMVDQIRRVHGISPDEIRTNLARIKGFPGVMGSITILPSRDSNLKYILMQIKGSKPTVYRG